MKTLLLSLFLIPALCFGQKKKDSKIIVTVSDTANLFNKVATHLYNEGYTLEQKDPDLGFMATAEKKQKKTNASIKVRAMVKDSTVTFTGVSALDAELELFGAKMTRTFDPILFIGVKGSIARSAWNELDALAKSFGERVSYAK